jgi:hypothetical protein
VDSQLTANENIPQVFDECIREVFGMLREPFARFLGGPLAANLIHNATRRHAAPRRSAIDIKQVLKYDITRELLRIFMSTEYSAENVDFMEVVSEFRAMFFPGVDRKKILQNAQYICSCFVGAEATSPLNIGSQQCDMFLQQMTAISANTDLLMENLFQVRMA